MSFRDWDIFDEMARLRRELGHLAANLQVESAAQEECAPPVDILEREDALVLLVDLPGVRRDDIELRVEADTLTLEGQRLRPEGEQGVRLERPMGRFRRSFRMGGPISADTVQATWREGVLEIVLCKAPPQEPAHVRVTVE
jgi:HSP20 family protein